MTLARAGLVSWLALAPASQVSLAANDEPAGLARERPWEGFSIFVDQDVFFAPAFDQDYTMGVEFVCVGRWVRSARLSAPLEWLDGAGRAGRLHARLLEDDVRPDESVGASEGQAVASHSIHFGNVTFTPRKAELGLVEPIFDDRPFANLMYLKVRRTSARRGSAMVTDLTLGVLGLNVGKWVQTKIHEARDDVIPGGWPNQIANGGELTLKYRVSPRWRLASSPGAARPFGAELAAAPELNLGYYTNASAGVRARVGLIRSPWWAFERNAIADVRGPRSVRGIFGGGRPFVEEFFGWASGGGTAWLYNSLLQGQLRASRVELRFDERTPAPLARFTADAQVGVTLRLRPGVALTYAVQWLSPTFRGPKERTHSWGSVYVNYQK